MEHGSGVTGRLPASWTSATVRLGIFLFQPERARGGIRGLIFGAHSRRAAGVSCCAVARPPAARVIDGPPSARQAPPLLSPLAIILSFLSACCLPRRRQSSLLAAPTAAQHLSRFQLPAGLRLRRDAKRGGLGVSAHLPFPPPHPPPGPPPRLAAAPKQQELSFRTDFTGRNEALGACHVQRDGVLPLLLWCAGAVILRGGVAL